MKKTLKSLLVLILSVLMLTSSIPAFAGETQLLKVSGFNPDDLYKEGSDVLIIRTTDLRTAAEKYVFQVFGVISTSEMNRLVEETTSYFLPNTGIEFESNNDGTMITRMYKQDSGDYIVFTRPSSGFGNPVINGTSKLDFLKSHPEVENITVMGMIIYDKRQPDEQNNQTLSMIEPALQDPTFSPDGTVIFNNKPAATFPINDDFFNPEKSPLGTGTNTGSSIKDPIAPITPVVPVAPIVPVQKPEIKPTSIVPVEGVIENIPSLQPSQDIQVSIKDEDIKITENVIEALQSNDSDIVIKTETGKTKEVDTELIDKELVIVIAPDSNSNYPEDVYIDLSNQTDEDFNPVPNVKDNDVIIVIGDSKDNVVIGTPEVIITIPDRTKDEVVLITKDEDKKTDKDQIDPITIVVIDEERAIADVSFVDTKDDDYIVVSSEDDKMVYTPSNKNNPEQNIKAEIESGDTVSLWEKVDGSHITDPIIKDLYVRGIIQGYPDGTFGENKTITRAEASAMIYNSLSNTDRVKKNSSTFKDVNGSSWFAKYVLGNDAFKGYPDLTFKPQNNITKEEMYSLVSRLTILEDNVGKTNSFESSEWSKSNINKILNLGFINEVKNVKASITRGEVFKLIHKIVIEDLENQIF